VKKPQSVSAYPALLDVDVVPMSGAGFSRIYYQDAVPRLPPAERVPYRGGGNDWLAVVALVRSGLMS
jgi:hypothetical protein